jgi:hypothetical protein
MKLEILKITGRLFKHGTLCGRLCYDYEEDFESYINTLIIYKR